MYLFMHELEKACKVPSGDGVGGLHICMYVCLYVCMYVHLHGSVFYLLVMVLVALVSITSFPPAVEIHRPSR